MPLKPGNPDVYYGARPEQLNPTVRNELGGHVMPSTQHDLPMVPNFFLATKGQDGTLAVAGRQACYDGALGARGIHTLRSYQQEEPLYDNNAYAITSIYHGGGLKMFTSHVAPSPSTGGRPEYHMNQLRWFAMTDTADAFRQGAGAYRNARDWAEQQRNEAIMRANEKANEQANEEVDEEANTVEASTPTGDAPPSPAISFVTAVSETEAHTVTQESRTSVDEVSGGLNEVSGNLDESDGSEDLTVHIIPAKRPNERSKQAQTRKRRIVDTTAEQSETVVDGKR